jgi:hypothetical protein
MKRRPLFAKRYISLPNIPGQVSPLASGMAPAREAEKAGGMTEVPKAQGLGALARCALFCSRPHPIFEYLAVNEVMDS